nr:protein aurora borealis-like [Nerophis lumbriciformis]XP_061783897.1 protein aurora borealis-like [Nerophis lumbriciformis]
MGDHTDIHITPGRSSVRNPFESPNDYRHLQETLVPSPSVFKSRATPPKFTWNVEEMASLFPVDIDPEEIQRQSFYLSQTRADSDIEEKRQNAIEQFFTKGAIVPSPWSVTETRKIPLMYKKSPLSPMITEEPEKHSVSCQTTLSLPLALDLERLLGEYYRNEEVACDAVQESLSSSSLRRKLFLDGQGAFSSSDGSSPPTPDRCLTQEERLLLKQHEDAAQDFKGAASSSFASPLSCNVTASTPSTAQFSSSPIQHGRFRDCSLGSLASPVFPASMGSPTISPILAHTPKGSAEWKQPRHLTPHGVTVDMDTLPCAKSPFVEGCSPIRSCSPHQLRIHPDLQQCARSKPRSRFRSWGSPPLISPILNPKLPDSQDSEDLAHSSSSPAPTIDVDPSSSLDQNTGSPGRLIEPVKTEPGQEIRMEGQIEDEEEDVDNGILSGQLTSSRMVNASATESSQMFVSLLGDGSSIRYDSSMQVDSGYNTTSAGAGSLIDGLGSDCPGKESFTSNFPDDAFHLTRTSKVKARLPHH